MQLKLTKSNESKFVRRGRVSGTRRQCSFLADITRGGVNFVKSSSVPGEKLSRSIQTGLDAFEADEYSDDDYDDVDSLTSTMVELRPKVNNTGTTGGAPRRFP